ncbi:MAG: putative urea ABC transporter substrate-binding protein [Pseudomonadota bacterium]
MNFMQKCFVIISLMLASIAVNAADKFNVCWSHYTGWEPWQYAQDSGILKKWADKQGIEIKLTLINDYIESINLYTTGQFDACTMTNMDALTIPAAGGIDSTVLIVGDYSNGNDGIVVRGGKTMADIKGLDVLMVELSVSHYMLARALTLNGMSERDINLINTSDADIASAFIAQPKAAVVTWNPPLQQVRQQKNANLVFDSSKIPGEILDLMVVKTAADARLKKALVGAWYETMKAMSSGSQLQRAAIAVMAKSAGGTEAEFNAQLNTTKMFYSPADAVKIVQDANLIATMDAVRKFSFEKGLYGTGAKNIDVIGIEFPNNKILGNPKNIKLRFDSSFVVQALDGKL